MHTTLGLCVGDGAFICQANVWRTCPRLFLTMHFSECSVFIFSIPAVPLQDSFAATSLPKAHPIWLINGGCSSKFGLIVEVVNANPKNEMVCSQRLAPILSNSCVEANAQRCGTAFQDWVWDLLFQSLWNFGPVWADNLHASSWRERKGKKREREHTEYTSPRSRIHGSAISSATQSGCAVLKVWAKKCLWTVALYGRLVYLTCDFLVFLASCDRCNI